MQAVLIGETFMRAKDKVLALNELYGKKISPKVKFCAMKTIEDIAIVNRYTPDYVGFIFAKSKRQVSMQTASDLAKNLDEKIIVSLFKHKDIETIIDKLFLRLF